MRYIIHKMGNKVPECFPRLQVFLPAYMAIPAQYLRATVKAIFFFPFFKVRHSLKFD